MPSFQETKAAFLDRPFYCLGGGLLAGVIGFFISALLAYGVMIYLATNSARVNPSTPTHGFFYIWLGFVFFIAPVVAFIGFIAGLLGTVFQVTKKRKQN